MCVYILYIYIRKYTYIHICIHVIFFSCPHMTVWKDIAHETKTNLIFNLIFFCYFLPPFPPPFYFSKRGNIDVYFFFSFENIRKKERFWFGLLCFALEVFFNLFAPFLFFFFFSIEWTQNPCMAEKRSLKCFCKAQFSLFFFLIFLLLSTCVIFRPQITFINMILKKLFSKWTEYSKNYLTFSAIPITPAFQKL